jgi:hypothetical protein
MDLIDTTAQNLARYTTRRSGKIIEILVPCDDIFLDMVVVSAVGADGMNEREKVVAETAGEVVQALVGV